MNKTILFLLPLILSYASLANDAVYTGPVFDMHLHASRADANGPIGTFSCPEMLKYLPPSDPKKPWIDTFLSSLMNPLCENPVRGAMTDEAVLKETITELEANNAIGVISGSPEMLKIWKEKNQQRFLPSLQLNLVRDPYGPLEARKIITENNLMAIGEISNQYAGIAPDDGRMDGFYSLAEELDIPVAIHMGAGPPGAFSLFPKYRVSAADPTLLEPVLHKYPKLRVSIMHMAEGYLDSVKMMLYTYPNIYLDIGGLSWMRTNEEFKEILLGFVNAGWGGRIMFGSDQMNWPGLITPAIDVIRNADYLTLEQKEAILWSNAIRFLKLNDKEMRERAMGLKIKKPR